ncbi:MAG: ABC transporter ATP-binding protein [Oscillospiraceae bacterium]|nr:ABC transporter ATP-binding protein [Oscillospiraceae bacterium]
MKTARPFRIFCSYYHPHRKLLALDLTCAVIAALLDLIFPLVTRYSLQSLLPDRLFLAFFLIMGSMILIQLIRALFSFFVSYQGHVLGVRFEADIRNDLFAHMQTLSFRFFDLNRTGQLMNRVTGDLFEISELSHHGPEQIVSSATSILGGLLVMFLIQWRLALVISITFPLVVLIIARMRKRLNRASLQVKERLAGINNEMESCISGMRTAKAFANEPKESEKFQSANGLYVNAKSNYYKNMGLFHASQDFSLSVINIIVILFGGLLIMRGRFDTVELITFTLYISTFFNPIRQILALVEQLNAGTAGFHRFLELMCTDPDINDKEGAVSMARPSGEIQFHDVSFSYDGIHSVLSHINLTVPAGKTLAVVGPSGGGKTTLCQLIPRFYEVTEGAITIDGQDIRDVTQLSLRENIGMVQQEVFLFAGTILDNIRYGRLNATLAEVMDAARRAEIHDDILNMPNGYETYVGERGIMLSGGQKQRIAIARVFLKNPPILILDEATSALDSVTELRIQKALTALSQGRTTILIAHRLSTIRNANEIIVVEEDGIAEQGSHEALLAQNGIYAKLYQVQQHLK